MAFDSSKPNSTDPIGYFTETNTKVAVTPGNYLNCPGANAQQKVVYSTMSTLLKERFE